MIPTYLHSSQQLPAECTAINCSSIKVAPQQAQNIVLHTSQPFGAHDCVFLCKRSSRLSAFYNAVGIWSCYSESLRAFENPYTNLIVYSFHATSPISALLALTIASLLNNNLAIHHQSATSKSSACCDRIVLRIPLRSSSSATLSPLASTFRVLRRSDAIFLAVPHCYGPATISSGRQHTPRDPLLRLSLQCFVHTARFWTTAWQFDNPVFHLQLWQKALMVDRRLGIECSILHG